MVSIHVENLSDKDLKFQPVLKLMRWTTGEEIPASGKVRFEGLRFDAHSDGAMTVNLSEAYDLALLETPLEGTDWYYLVLTNNGFLFGQDWMCAVDFAGDDGAPEAEASPAAPSIPSEKPEYPDVPAEAVASVSPVLPGNRLASGARLTLLEPEEAVTFDPSIPAEEQLQLTGLHWQSVDAFRQPLAGEGEYALVLSAAVPQTNYRDAGRELPLFYLFTYEKEAAQTAGACAFLQGELIPFTDLEAYRVFEDGQYVCYDLGPLVCGDMDGYIQRFLEENPDLYCDQQVRERIDSIYAYYQAHLADLLCFTES